MSMEAFGCSFFVLGYGKDKNSDFCAITLHFVSNVIKWVSVDRKSVFTLSDILSEIND